ncbi:sialate O-acetylesterase-like [Pomacea canaliculata]|uniref:sialate O-acetylesterase-like n=1 Tax=Pomacea canaliculata TaxID=400727 RepID=UPI000D734B54|nr:sialate O-acetylesterase-like [Pomacea canaliculata]
MVLQQAPQRAVIWGYHPVVGYRVVVEVGSMLFSSYVEPGPTPDEGIWSVTLDPVPAGGPYTVFAITSGGTISLSDVMFGDVWVCSGQSNMQFTVSQMLNASEELAASVNYTQIRLFTVAMQLSASPLVDFMHVWETWSMPNNATLGGGNFTYFSAVCWLFGKLLYEELQYPIGLIDTTWGGTPIEAWSSPDALAACGVSQDSLPTSINSSVGPRDPSVLWNSMVYPLLKMTIFGAIWYQGESDSDKPTMPHYNCTFPAMIDDWRAKFSEQSGTSPIFPFGFVQLAPDRSSDVRVGFPDIRWHQTADYGYVPNPRMPNVFMSVAIDLPDFNSTYGSIHPRDKQDVAKRLLLSALSVAYSRGPAVTSGPLPMQVTQELDIITLDYGGLWVLRVSSSLGFELCCSKNVTGTCAYLDAGWVAAPILSSTVSAVALDATGCSSGTYVIGIRYAWRESPFDFKNAAVYTVAFDLPAPPFISFKPESAGNVFNYVFDWSKPTILP